MFSTFLFISTNPTRSELKINKHTCDCTTLQQIPAVVGRRAVASDGGSHPNSPQTRNNLKKQKKEGVYDLPEPEQPPSSPHTPAADASLTSPANPAFPAGGDWHLRCMSLVDSLSFLLGSLFASETHQWKSHYNSRRSLRVVVGSLSHRWTTKLWQFRQQQLRLLLLFSGDVATAR